MLIIDSKDCENIDKALKKYKKKFEKAKVLVQLRERQSYTKPSVKRRGEVLKAVYKQQVAAGKFEDSYLTFICRIAAKLYSFAAILLYAWSITITYTAL